MAKRGGQKGNDNAKRGTLIRDALRMELAQDRQRLRRIIRAWLDKAEEGDVPAIKEFNDRMEGKVAQELDLKGEMAITKVERVIVNG